MKKNIIRIITGVFIAITLTGCSQMDAYKFLIMGNKTGNWGNDAIDLFGRNDDDDEDWWDVDDDEDEDDDNDNRSSSSNNKSSSNNNNSSSSNNTDNSSGELTFDENSTKFNHTFSECSSGTVAIQVRSEECKDTDLVIPSKYVDSTGAKYQVVRDYGNGFGYLSAQKITLPEGFKEIHEGFDQCMYVKRIVLPSTITKIYKEILTSCISLQKIDYAGTKAEWNAITKEERWNYRAPAFEVSCKDGIINVEKGPTD